MLFPEDRWEPWPVDVRLSAGPETVAVVDEDALAELPRSGPVGFAPPAPPKVKRPRK